MAEQPTRVLPKRKSAEKPSEPMEISPAKVDDLKVRVNTPVFLFIKPNYSFDNSFSLFGDRKSPLGYFLVNLFAKFISQSFFLVSFQLEDVEMEDAIAFSAERFALVEDIDKVGGWVAGSRPRPEP